MPSGSGRSSSQPAARDRGSNHGRVSARVASRRATGHKVRPLARDPGKLRPRPGVDVVVGDPTRPGSMVPAVDGVDAVVFARGRKAADTGRNDFQSRSSASSRLRTAQKEGLSLRLMTAQGRVRSGPLSGAEGDGGFRAPRRQPGRPRRSDHRTIRPSMPRGGLGSHAAMSAFRSRGRWPLSGCLPSAELNAKGGKRKSCHTLLNDRSARKQTSRSRCQNLETIPSTAISVPSGQHRASR